MIDIFVNGERLDVPNKELSFHFSEMLFSGKLIDDYSIDFEIPRTQKNERVLNPSGLLYRPQQFGDLVQCVCCIPGETFECGLQVVELTQHTIKIALFALLIPENIMKSKLSDLIHDDDTTIFIFPSPDTPALLAKPTVDCGLFPFDMANGAAIVDLPSYYLPSIRLNKVFKMLTAATGVVFPTVDDKIYLTATNRRLCPYYLKQYFDRTKFEQSAFNKYEKNVETLTPSTLTFNRKLTASFAVILTVYSTALRSVNIQISQNGGQSWQLLKSLSAKGTSPGPGQPPEPGQDSAVFNVNLKAGDIVRYVIDGSDGVGVSSTITYSNVEHNADLDGNTELLTDEGGMWANIGTITNLNEITVKDLLTSVCWQLDRTLRFANNKIEFVEPRTAKSIKAIIESINPSTGVLGKNTNIIDSNDRKLLMEQFNSQFLTDKKTLFKSSFYYCEKSKYSDLNAIHIYTKNDDGTYELNEIEGIPISYTFTSSRPSIYKTWLSPLEISQTIKQTLNGFSKVLTVTATTFDNIKGYHYVIIDGMPFAIVEGDRSIDTGLTKFKALQIDKIEGKPSIVIDDLLLWDDGDGILWDDNDNIIL